MRKTPVIIASIFALAGCSKPGPHTPAEYTRAFAKVFEYTPAPGQFINDGTAFEGVDTPEKAAGYAAERLNSNYYVSLGAFGGYIVVGFDRPVNNSGDYDFGILGNQTRTSSEPGIVWVMSDENGNGLPDDTWYELTGSETDSRSTRRGCSVTYYRPEAGEEVAWTDSDGGSGTIARNSHHTQESYYPAWIAGDEYTLAGTRLESRSTKDEDTGEWTNAPFGWGYADNWGSDRDENGGPRLNRFRISDAIDPEGSPAGLTSIDFIKVQTGVQAMAGPLGEVSTEVFGFYARN